MPNLLEQQARFVRAIFNPSDDTESLLCAIQRSSVQSGIAIYRNNIFSNYRRVLSNVYPVIQRLVGEDFFTTMSDAYIHATPSRSGDVRNYGATFAEFISTYPPALQLFYLHDVAQIEWACHQVLNKPESVKFEVTQLAEIPAEQLAQSHIELCAASALVSSPYPAVKIWQTNQPDYVGDGNVDLSAGAEYGLVLCQQFKVTLHPLSAAEFEFSSQLSQHKTLAEALLAAQIVAADFDLGSCLMRHISHGAISQISSTDSSGKAN
ncbi:MAG: DNA-binding domain-containing protein [Gallionella sp.]